MDDVAKAILEKVKHEMDVAEEIGGPEGMNYRKLVEGIAAEAFRRRDVHAGLKSIHDLLAELVDTGHAITFQAETNSVVSLSIVYDDETFIYRGSMRSVLSRAWAGEAPDAKAVR